MEYYLAVKKYETLPFETTWMNIKGIMLDEISLTENTEYNMISYMWNLKK